MAQQMMTQQPSWTVSVRNTFIVVHDDHDVHATRRPRSCPPLSSSSSRCAEASAASPLVPVCYEPQPADRLPPRKGSSGALETSGEPAPTTMMIRNIACCCSQEDVIEDINAMGFAGSFDFIYLPRHRKSNLGYAFINFTTSEVALDFRFRMHGHRFSSRTQIGGSSSQKACTITPAALQGLAANKKHFRRTRVIKSDRGPTFFQKQDFQMVEDAEIHPVQKEEVPVFQQEATPPAWKEAIVVNEKNKFELEGPYASMGEFHNLDALMGC